MIIGITGGTGCGKTTFLEVVSAYGGTALDCDRIYHQLLQTDSGLLSEIDRRFPGVVSDGVPDLKKLGNIVFHSKDELQALNAITHGAVKDAVQRRVACASGLVAIDAIGLFESGLDKLCKLTVAITAPEHLRIARLMSRDHISAQYAKARIDAQPPQETFVRRCDYHLENDTTPEAFREKCIAFFNTLGIMKETK